MKTIVTIDDKLPFIKPKFFERLFGKRPTLIYAKSANDDNLYLASLFEKAVVKLVCNSIYSEGISPENVFSLFSDCMLSCCVWLKTNSKLNVVDHLKYEVDYRSSVVLGITPDLKYKPENISAAGHEYVVMDYDLQHKAIKLYNQRFCKKTFDICNNLPVSFIEKADPKKGELWITLDQLEKRDITMNYLCSKKMYKSVFKVNRSFKLTDYYKNCSAVKFAYQVDVKETSTFMINLLSFDKEMVGICFDVFTDDNKQQKVELNNEIPPLLTDYQSENVEEENNTFYHKFKLQPNKYVFDFKIGFEKTNAENVDLLLKIGSTSECTFKEIKNEDRTR